MPSGSCGGASASRSALKNSARLMTEAIFATADAAAWIRDAASAHKVLVIEGLDHELEDLQSQGRAVIDGMVFHVAVRRHGGDLVVRGVCASAGQGLNQPVLEPGF